eukprot:Gb_37323 [translate_table: standard]
MNALLNCFGGLHPSIAVGAAAVSRSKPQNWCLQRIACKLSNMEPQSKRVVRNKQVILVSYADEGAVTADHLQVRETQLDVQSLGRDGSSGDVVVENLWVSVDPALRHRMKQSSHGLFPNSFQLHQPIVSRSIAKVVASANPQFKVGDIVLGTCEVSEYAMVNGGSLTKVNTNDVAQPSHYLGVLGTTGLTAWVGLVLIGDPKPGEQVFVTAAAGAVGLLVGQLAKIKGCRVVGSTGSDEKVRLLKEEFGLDEAFNYKAETDWDAALTRYFPEGIDIFFDNVGGRMLEAALNHINLNARIPLCGMISQYNEDLKQSYGVRNLLNLVGKCAKMQGFRASYYLTHMNEFREEMTGYMKQGKLKYKEDVIQGIDNFLEALNFMFSGGNTGKTLVRISHD